MVDGEVVKSSFIMRVTTKAYLRGGPLPQHCTILVYEGSNPPEYYNNTGYPVSQSSVLIVAVKNLCTLTVDVRKLAPSAFKLCKGKKGEYYEVEYDLGLIFGPELVVEFRYRGNLIHYVSANYNA
jgi:hypothetical protein